MNGMTPFIELKTSSGKPFKMGEMTVTPEAQALVIKLPFMGFVWNRPTAVVIEQNGLRDRFPIIDVTRATVMSMAGVGAFLTFCLVMLGMLGKK